MYVVFFLFKPKSSYVLRISDWSSDVCSSDLISRVPVLITTTDPGMARPAKTAVQLRLMRTTSKLGGAVGTVPAAGAGVGGERKSVVTGRSVAVSEEIGVGRRNKINIDSY